MCALTKKMKGAILMNHAAEEVFKDLKVPETVFMRPGYFMENWATAVETVKEGGFLFGTITPTSMEFPHVSKSSCTQRKQLITRINADSLFFGIADRYQGHW